ncbi:MAG TPA: tryptophan halogenase family protein [Sphingomicrobium sp.]|nr:tryptophan halogenase family protein [Sphingomicrobium sp.]
MRKRVLIVGGGTAGWLTAGYLAKRLAADLPAGAEVRLVESSAIGILGVGEGTFPTIRSTLSTIGLGEADMIRRCGASFKQGARFANWRRPAKGRTPHHYLHAFQEADERSGLELLPYWLLGAAGNEHWDEVATPQTKAADAHRAPKLPTHADYAAPLNYAFHFDAVALAELLRDQAVASGVGHLVDKVTNVLLDGDGAIAGVETDANGLLTADLYIDCTGFRAELIGKALGVPFKSCRDSLFCDSALALQVPHATPEEEVASYTISTAQRSGWIWDIALDRRRGIGHVYSSDHSSREEAEQALRDYIGPAADGLEARHIPFTPGFREINWHMNCVAIGLSSGFFEPLEATGIVFSEVAASMVANLFPWGGDYETSARQFNANMLRRYERALDFIKLHYCLSDRDDSDFWRDNVRPDTVRDSLHELLDRWRFRPPNEMDVDTNVDIFPASSWQYVLYGLDWKTDLSAKRGAYRYFDDAVAAFAEVRRQADFAVRNLPSNRQLLTIARQRDFGPEGKAAA